MIEVYPHRVDYELLLTAKTAVSHHDPAVQDDSNQQSFNRQKQIICQPTTLAAVNQEMIDRFAAAHPVPLDIAAICADLTFPEYAGVVLVRLFLDAYNSRDGAGIFEGMERYSRLEARLRHAAIASSTLRRLWDRLCDSLKVPIHGGDTDLPLLDVLTLPGIAQQAVLRSLIQDYRSIVSIARLWHTTGKLENEAYAAAAGQMAMVNPKRVLEFAPLDAREVGAVIAEVPTISGNSLRHQMVREPGWLRLFGLLGMRDARPGLGPVPAGVEAMFYNGGNIESGAKQPSGTFGLAVAIRGAYPLLDLVGGVTDSFDVGESRLQIASWLVCRENAAALAGTPAEDLPAARLSVFDMMDDVTITRHAGQVGEGQMIVGFESLCAGAQAFVRLSLVPHTEPRTHGALVDAIEAWRADDATIGGGAARGFGHCTAEWLRRHEDADAYRQAYLDDVAANADALREGLVSGTLCTKSVVLT
jgi:hypothetical protein